MSTNRGKTLHREFPALLAPYWPSAEPCPPGRNGRDVLGTPGVAWEVKCAGLDNLRPDLWMRQAIRNAGQDMPIVAWFGPGVGIHSPQLVAAYTPLPVMLRLLKEGGYTG